MSRASVTLQRSFSSDYADDSALQIHRLSSAFGSPIGTPPAAEGSSFLTIPSINPDRISSSLNVLLDSSEGLPRSSADSDWAERGAAVSTTALSGSSHIVKRSVSDFEFGKELGVGSYSTVVLAKDKHTGIKYAVKILDKRHIIKERKVKYVNIEKHALNRLNNHPGIISLFFTFQDKHHLYFALDYASNGELLGLIRKYKTLNEDCVRYFGAQILDAISYMHLNGIVHRDIKPENILLDPNMRVKITDFGTACLLEKGDGDDADYPLDVRAKSFVGTAEYVLPELLDSKYCGKPGDIWAFGCIMYQLVAGKPPFKASNDYQTFQKITHLQYAFSAGFPTILRDLVRHILVLQPLRRLRIPDIQTHYFFESIDFSDIHLVWGKEHPPLGPYKMSAKSMQAVPSHKKPAVALPKIAAAKAHAPVRPTTPQSKSSPRVSQSPRTVAALGAAHVLKTRAPSLSLSVMTVSSALSSAPGLSHASVVTKPGMRTVSAPSSLPSPLLHAGPEYIPGTNILRPKAMLRNVARPRTSINNLATVSAPAPAMELALAVWPMTAEEERLKPVFGHPDERILKHGSVVAYKELSADFERKHRGTLVELPLGYARQTSSRKTTPSILSQVASGQTGGLRERSASTLTNDENVAMADSPQIPSAIVEFPVEAPAPADPLDSENSQTHGKFRKAFHMLRMGHSKDPEYGHGSGQDTPSPPVYYSLDRPLQCMLVVTTHGRALVAAVLPNDPSPKILLEVRLVHPQVRFREVLLGAPSRFQKPTQDQGTFAILTGKHAIAFQVERSQVAAWTLALAKSKVNEARRVVALEAPLPLPSLLLPILPPSSENDLHSSFMPRTLDPIITRSPVMNHASSEEVRAPSAPVNHGPVSPVGRGSTSPSDNVSPPPANHAPVSPAYHTPTSPVNHAPLRLPVMLTPKTFEETPTLPKKRIVVRRVVPSSPTVAVPSSSAISRDDMLHAAQLAVSQSTFSQAPSERRLSFSKDSLASREAPRQKVTMKTSKLLARSRGH